MPKIETLIRELQEFVDQNEFYRKCGKCGTLTHIHDIPHHQVRMWDGKVIEVGPKCPNCTADIKI